MIGDIGDVVVTSGNLNYAHSYGVRLRAPLTFEMFEIVERKPVAR